MTTSNYNETNFGSSESIYLDNNDTAIQYRYADPEDQIKMLEERTNVENNKNDFVNKINFINSSRMDNLLPITFDGESVSYKCLDCGSEWRTSLEEYKQGDDCECKLEG